ncbi:metalloregulator ArsR/SmtB family transcription factor [Marinimicrobium sp. C6131]|uniref:ArsR/SmtB family transcription factor n=1 Tax=Marinimicrobium sp. C6131 TaxID=3022676 RepID=UPI00223E6D1D|nr:metalloregulator ArsR/SmtB family transcription factor [Marinimicrobium sp. C6131]UZJ43401.1 metalloregulator ArsR/SmtB family transcription factor [Marinimicrobium sp. C6131]
MNQAHTLPDPDAPAPDALPQLLKAAGDPLRLDILRVMKRDSFGVLELCQLLDAKQSGMSHHLKVLTNAGLLAPRREGNSIFYRRAYLAPDNPLQALQQQLFATLDREPLPATLNERLKSLRGERALASQHFFADNAHKFRAQQDLIASYPVYADQVGQLLANTPLPDNHLALEVGPGEGEFLPVLAKRFKHLVALDNAPIMLERAQALAADQGLSNVEFIGGDTRALKAHKVLADCIVVNMVLHHTPSPADIFQDLSGALVRGGALLVTDLCRHEQTWAREACGDLWQGFEPDDLSRWAVDAGLSEGQSVYFALRNGFQIQLRQFFKSVNPLQP